MVYQIPNFLMGNAAADFSPIQNALAQYQKAQQFNATNDREYAQLAELQRQHGIQNALARDQYGIAVRTADRQDELAPLQQQHLQAQTQNLLAHGRYYDAASKFKYSDAPPSSGQIDPTGGMGMDEAGNLIFVGNGVNHTSGPGTVGLSGIASAPRVQRMVAGALDNNASVNSASREHADFGPTGKTSADIPGLVVDARGRPNSFATQMYQQQKALDAVPDDARTRLLKAQATQNTFRALYGNPGPGRAYTVDGKIVDLGKKESVQDRQSLALAQQGLDNLDFAEKVLLGEKIGVDESGRFIRKPARTNVAQDLAGDTWTIPGTKMEVGSFGEAGRGFRAARAAVIDLNFAISGKSVSNAERAEFLKIYMPMSTDSAATKEWKFEATRNFFNKAIAARKTGASDDEIAALYQGAILDGLKGVQPQKFQGRAPGAGETPRNPASDRLRNKYGLE